MSRHRSSDVEVGLISLVYIPLASYRVLHLVQIKCALVSNFDHRLPELLDDLKLSKYFGNLAYSGKVGVSKPNAKIFQFALAQLNIISEEALCVGDSLEMDYYPAQGLNINALLINRTKEDVKGIKTISDLTQIVEFLDSKSM